MRLAIRKGLAWCALTLTFLLPGTEAVRGQLPTYAGGAYGNAAFAHDARYRWAVGVQNVQVARSAPDNPSQTDGEAFFYRHHQFIAYWGGRFWVMHDGDAGTRLAWSTNGLDWSVGDSSRIFEATHHRMAFYVASNGRLLASHWIGERGQYGTRLIREVYGPNSYGPIYTIKTNYSGAYPLQSWPYYTSSASGGFVSACDELRNNRLFRQQWQEEDQENDFYTISRSAIPGVDFWKAFNWYRLPDNRIVGAWKGVYLTVSAGADWNPGTVPTPLVWSSFYAHTGAKTWMQRMEDGRHAFVGCASGANAGRRWPLAVTTSPDGWTFDTPYLVIAGDMPMQRYEEPAQDNKEAGEQYVRGICPGNGDPPGSEMWLTYSMNKEDIWVASVPIPVVGQVTNDVFDDFQGQAAGRRVASWNTYSPQWAPVAIAAEGTNRFVRLEDRDLCEYASVMRVFPQSTLTRLAFDVRAHQTNATVAPFEIDVVSGDGARAVALALNPTNGQIAAWNGTTRQNIRSYSTNVWIRSEMIVDALRQVYDMRLDGVSVLTNAAFLETASSVERIVFRTGEFRLRDFTRRPYTGPAITNRLANADLSQSLSRYDLDNFVAEKQTHPLIASIDQVSSGRPYALSNAVAGAPIYTDRTFVIQTLPSEFSGLEMIRTAQDDANVSTTAHLRFTLSRAAVVYVAFDRDAPRLPGWLAGWTDTGVQIVSDYAGGFRLYRKAFAAGQVTLGGNDLGYTGAVSSYFVLAEPALLEVVVSSVETWDGRTNPHAADGVTLSGLGTESDPVTYSIPKGMRLTATGRINLHSTNDYSIKFVIQGGDLQMDAGAVLNLERYQLRTGRQVCILDLSGANSITGSGRIGPVTASTSTPRVLTIQNAKDVRLVDIDLSVYGVNNQGRHLNLTASGLVEVTGKIDNSDQDTGGEGSWDVNVLAREIRVNSVDTRCMRTGSGTRPTGNINLRALGPPGYNPADGANNTAANRITISGTLVSTNRWTSGLYGAITNETVILQLATNAGVITAASKLALRAGKVRADAGPADLFVNQSGGVYSAAHVVEWSGTLAPERPVIQVGNASGGQLSLHWNGEGFVLQQNADLGNPAGWVTAPSGTNMPAVVPITSSNLFYRVKWPLE